MFRIMKIRDFLYQILDSLMVGKQFAMFLLILISPQKKNGNSLKSKPKSMELMMQLNTEDSLTVFQKQIGKNFGSISSTLTKKKVFIWYLKQCKGSIMINISMIFKIMKKHSLKQFKMFLKPKTLNTLRHFIMDFTLQEIIFNFILNNVK